MSKIIKKLYEKFTAHQAKVLLVKLDNNRKMYVVGE